MAAESSNLLLGDKLSTMVAVTVAVLASSQAIFSVKDGNIVQGMQRSQTRMIEYWSAFGASKVRQEVLEVSIKRLKLQMLHPSVSAQVDARMSEELAGLEEELKTSRRNGKQFMENATKSRQTFEKLDDRDDQFDLSEVGMATSIAIMAIAAIVKKYWLYYVGLLFGIVGLTMGLSGLFNLGIHPDVLIKWLT